VAQVTRALDESYPLAVAKMRLYLDKPKTRAVLLKPVRSNITEAHGQVAALLRGYDAAAVERIGLMSADALNERLDRFS